MLELSFIYPRSYQKKQLITLVILFITFFMVFHIIVVCKGQIISGFLATFLVSSLGFYISFIIYKQTLSFTLCQAHIQHHSTKGSWCIPWNNIHSIEIPTINHENWHQDLPWVGLKLHNYEPMLESISFRLASQILIEQRALLLTGFCYAEHANSSLENMLFDDKPYIAQSGKIYRGLLAMLANRMIYTRELLGFDVFIDENLLDRPPQDFVGIARRYLSAFGGISTRASHRL